MIPVWAPKQAFLAQNEQIAKYGGGIDITDKRWAVFVNLGSTPVLASVISRP